MERAILEAVPPIALARGAGAIVSVMITREGRVVDAYVRTGAPPEVHLREALESDPAKLHRWLSLTARRQMDRTHDLSGPATGVLAALETVLEFEPIPESTRALLREARGGMLRITRLLQVKPVLPWSAVDLTAGPFGRFLERWSRRVVETFDPGGQRLEVRSSGPDTVVRIDGELLEGSLTELITNAWKQRDGQRAHVTVEGRVHDGWLEIEVGDDGRGVGDPEAAARVGEIGFSAHGKAGGQGLFSLRWALRDRGAVVIRPKPKGTRVSVFVRSSHG